MNPSRPTNWALREPHEAAAQVENAITKLGERSNWRHQMAARGAMVYSASLGTQAHGGLFQSLPFDAYQRNSANKKWGKHRWNHGRSAMQTIVAKIAGLDQPKSQNVTTEASWEEKAQAVWADRFVEGNFHERQGQWQDIWDLARHGMLLSCASTGNVGIRVEPDFVFKRVSHMLRSTLNTYVDRFDCGPDGSPLSTFDVTWENPEVLAEDPRWKDGPLGAGARDHILKSADVCPRHLRPEDEPDFDTQLVKVITSWRLPFGKFRGREARFVGGRCIQWDDYEHDQPRIALFRASPRLGDPFWSENLLESVLWCIDTANDVVTSAERAMRLLSGVLVAYDTDSTPSKGVQNAKDVSLLKYSSNKGEAPRILTTPIVDPSRMNFAKDNIEQAMEILGINQMHTRGQQPAGLHSGRAVRMVAALFSERHSILQRRWRHWLGVDTAKLNVAAALEIGEHEPDWQVTWPGQDFDAKVSVEALRSIREKKYEMRPYVVSEQKNTPADRAEMANEMLANGQISNEAHAQLIQRTLDTPAATKGQSSQRRFFAKLIDEALHAKESEVTDPDYWATKYTSPPPWIRGPQAAEAMDQVFRAYMDAVTDEVPQYRRDVLKRTLEELDWRLQEDARKEALMGNVQTRVSVDAGPEMLGGPTAEVPSDGAIEGAPGAPGFGELAPGGI